MKRQWRLIQKLMTGFFLPVLLYCPSYAQDSTENNFTAAAISNTINLYYQFTNKQSRLYNGLEYYDYPVTLEGHAYFLDSSWKKGYVFYDGLPFYDVSMLYDIVRDELVILHFNNFKKMGLLSEKIKEFTLQGHHFLYLIRDSIGNSLPSTGFYEDLYDGASQVLAKRIKIIEERITNQVEQFITVHNRYYIRVNGRYHVVDSYNALMSVLKDHARDVRQYLRKNRIRYRKNPQSTIISAAVFYDSLKK